MWAIGAWVSDRAKRAQLNLKTPLSIKAKKMKEAGENIIDFSYMSFDAPPQSVIDAVKEALTSGYPKPELRGLPTLRKIVAEETKLEKGIDVDSTNVQITCGGTMQALYLTIQATINPGDEVIVFCPDVSYDEIVKLAGGTPVYVEVGDEEDGFKFGTEQAEKVVSRRTKMIIVNTPHNPTGHVASREELENLADFAKRHDLLVLSDEVLERWVYDGRKHISIASLDDMQDRTIISSGITKSGMFNWRVGWLVANQELIKQVEKLLFWSALYPSPINQIGAQAFLTKAKDWIKDQVSQHEKKRDLIFSHTRKIDDFTCHKPEGTTVIFPCIKKVERSSMKFAEYLLDAAHVLVSPSIGYLCEGYLRIGFAKSEMEITQGMENIQRAVSKYHSRS